MNRWYDAIYRPLKRVLDHLQQDVTWQTLVIWPRANRSSTMWCEMCAAKIFAGSEAVMDGWIGFRFSHVCMSQAKLRYLRGSCTYIAERRSLNPVFIMGYSKNCMDWMPETAEFLMVQIREISVYAPLQKRRIIMRLL